MRLFTKLKVWWQGFASFGKSVFGGLSVGVIIAALLAAVRLFKSSSGKTGGSVPELFRNIAGMKGETDEIETRAEDARTMATDAVRNTSARTVAERYEGVGDAVDVGRARFAARVKNRVLTCGGRSIDEQHPE